MVLCVLPFLSLWVLTINHLRVDWDLNPQYSYGWVMPLLCVGLLLRRWRSVQDSGVSPGEIGSESVPSGWVALGFILLAGLYLPVRLIQEATPEWRMVSWAFGIGTIGLTLFGIFLGAGKGWLRELSFPILFFLVAVPWPSFIEVGLIQALTVANTASVIEVLTMIGIPAVQHGNLIEVGTGTVGVEEACSGIRSFQSSLMISLFLGEFFRLGWWRRIALVPVGFAVSFGFNILRTTLLTSIAAKKGVDAIDSYHDQAGMAILLGCSAVLWVMSWLMHRSQLRLHGKAGQALSLDVHPQTQGDGSGASAGKVAKESPPARTAVRVEGQDTHTTAREPIGQPPLAIRPSDVRVIPLFRYAVGLLLWLVLAEVGVASWYRIRESRLALGPSWSVAFPKEKPTYEEIPMHPKTAALLRFDGAQQGSWVEHDGTRWTGFYFDWRPGRVAGYLAKRHTPEVCLPASGATLQAGPDLVPVKIHGVELPMRHYVFESQGRSLQVFQCRWEAGAPAGASVRLDSESANLLRGIWAGRGKHGQKVLEFILSGPLDSEQAKVALAEQLEKLVRVEN